MQQMSGIGISEVGFEFGTVLRLSNSWAYLDNGRKAVRLLSLGGPAAICIVGPSKTGKGWEIGQASETLMLGAWEIDDAWPTTR